MNISDMYNASQANVVMAQSYARQSAGTSNQEASKAQKALDSADARQQQKVASTQQQVSSLGKLKSTLSETQSAAKDLQKLKPNATADEMAAAANKLANAYNNTLNTAKEANKNNGTNIDAVESRRTASNLRNAVTKSGLSTELQNAGFSVAEDGSVKIDKEKFKAAAEKDPEGLRKALEKVGQKVETASTKALDEKGELNSSINKLKKAVSESQNQGNSSSASAPGTSTKPDRSAEARRMEQEKFESELKRKYQSYTQQATPQKLAVAA